MKKKVDLCVPCAALLGEGFTLTKIAGGVNNKITCAHCGKRRYGDTYEMTKKKGGAG